jgi:VanZ family protein
MNGFVALLERRRVWRLLTVLLILIVYGSLYPFIFLPAHTDILAWVWDPGLPGIRDAIINLAVYFPAGFLSYCAASKSIRPGFRILTAILISGALSAALECLQSFDQGRVSSLLDLLLNTGGGAAGAMLAAMLPALMPAPFAFILLAIVARTYPFFPNLHPHLSGFQAAPALFAAVDWLAVRCALTVLLKRNNVTRELALLELAIPARIFIIDQGTSLGDIAGALLALAVGHLLFNRVTLRGFNRVTLRPQQLAPVMLLTAAARELLPFHFTSPPQDFHWIPFETFLAGPPAGAVLFLTKLLLYGGILWLFDPEARRIWRYGAAVAAIIGVLEWTQRYLPGRTPDITDPIIVMVAACALSALRTTTETPSAVSVGYETARA